MKPWQMSEVFDENFNNTGLNLHILGKTLECPGVTTVQMFIGQEAYDNGALIQNAFPFLSPDQREFLLTGLLPEEWDGLFGAPNA